MVKGMLIDKYERVIKSQQGVLFIKGEPGTAKSAIIKEIADRNHWQFFDIRLSQIDSSEIAGIPQGVVNGSDKYMEYLVPKWAWMANQKPTLIFFDELNRAPLEVRNAALQILLDRQIGHEFTFNKNVYFASAGNLGEEDGTEVEELDTALMGRLVPYIHNLTIDEWIEGFAKENVHKSIWGFVKAVPEYRDTRKAESEGNQSAMKAGAYASYRTYTFLSNFAGKDCSIKELIKITGEYGPNFIGSKASTKLTKFLHSQLKFNINDILNDFDSVKDGIEELLRDSKTDLLRNLGKIEIAKCTPKQVDNAIGFLELIDVDERRGYFNESMMENVDENQDFNKNYLKIMQHFENDFKQLQTIYNDDEEVEDEKKVKRGRPKKSE